MNQVPTHLECPRVEPTGPADVLAHAHNGLVAAEVWRQGASARVDEAWDARLARAYQREQAVRDRSAQMQEIQRLRLGTLAEDRTVAADYQRQLDGKLVEYHRGRALALGSRVTELTVKQSRFSGIRTRFAEMRQTYHQSRARKAAGRLIRAA